MKTKASSKKKAPRDKSARKRRAPRVRRKRNSPAGLMGVPTLTRLAEGIGVGMSHLSYVLAGKRKPTFLLAYRWAAFLGISMERLYDALYEDGGAVPADSPVMRRLAKERARAQGLGLGLGARRPTLPPDTVSTGSQVAGS